MLGDLPTPPGHAPSSLVTLGVLVLLVIAWHTLEWLLGW
ncbi:hypothetical protein Mal64_22820 [Pseudobythopirellula maris]|uniref:Uncharacterized protein n=1 Tax=Pseudobythopirellula maris TaxID=2527991 RepID=A0A5C5ZMS8_9BACT|nr:hypothetical protein Mal64_22820 [Pseudobythopirellula maris]